MEGLKKKPLERRDWSYEEKPASFSSGIWEVTGRGSAEELQQMLLFRRPQE